MAWGNLSAAWPYKGEPSGNPTKLRINTTTASTNGTYPNVPIFTGSGVRIDQAATYTEGTAVLMGGGTLAASNVFGGVVNGKYTWTAGEDCHGLTDRKYIEVHTEGEFWFHLTSAAETDIGDKCYESADSTYGPAAVTKTAGNGVCVGVITDVDVTNAMAKVKITGYACNLASVSS